MKTHYSAKELGELWSVHRSTAVRFMQRMGCTGVKFGPSKQSARRFRTEDVAKAESCLLHCSKTGEILR